MTSTTLPPAVVTGASAGIGAATARSLAVAGHPVALGARRPERCEEVAQGIVDDGGIAVALPLDVTDSRSVDEFAAQVRTELGDPSVVISNAGSITLRPASAATTEEMAYDLNVNVLGAHRLVRTFLPAMTARGSGDFVFISSDAVHTPRPGVAGYVAGKGGLEGMVSALRAELEGTGVRASVVRPGPTVSEISYSWDGEEFAALYASWERWGVQRHAGLLRPEHVASAVTSIVTAPPGMHLTLVEVQPVAPVRTD